MYNIINMNRFKMDFGNVNNQQLIRQMLNDKKSMNSSLLSSTSLSNSKMIDRVHKAKAGCSACGKKVM
jgi:hypothetical protein